MLIQHLFDSLSVVAPLSAALGEAPARIYDVGSGGGLPGVVLAIMRPHWSVTCIDAVENRIRAPDERRAGLAQSAGPPRPHRNAGAGRVQYCDVARLRIIG